MFYWLFCISIVFYLMGFVVNKQHDQVHSPFSLHIRMWFSCASIVFLGTCGIELLDDIQNIKMVVYGLISSVLFLFISWLTK